MGFSADGSWRSGACTRGRLRSGEQQISLFDHAGAGLCFRVSVCANPDRESGTEAVGTTLAGPPDRRGGTNLRGRSADIHRSGALGKSEHKAAGMLFGAGPVREYFGQIMLFRVRKIFAIF